MNLLFAACALLATLIGTVAALPPLLLAPRPAIYRLPADSPGNPINPFNKNYQKYLGYDPSRKIVCPSTLVNELLNSINQLRQENQVINLTVNPSISGYTQSWADYLAERNQFLHQPYNRYGSDLIYSYRGNPGQALNAQRVIDFWVNLNGISPVLGNEFENNLSSLFAPDSYQIGFGCASSPDELNAHSNPIRSYDGERRYYVVANIAKDPNFRNNPVPCVIRPTPPPLNQSTTSRPYVEISSTSQASSPSSVNPSSSSSPSSSPSSSTRRPTTNPSPPSSTLVIVASTSPSPSPSPSTTPEPTTVPPTTVAVTTDSFADLVVNQNSSDLFVSRGTPAPLEGEGEESPGEASEEQLVI